MRSWNSVLLGAALGLGLSAATTTAAPISSYFQTNLVSDLSGIAPVQDPNLKNPWGVSESATSPIWVSNQDANVATLYSITNGLTAARAGGPLVVPIPTELTPPNGPTGQVNNSTASFVITQSGTPTAAHFIFANLNGTISAWAAAPNPAQIEVPLPASGPAPVYTGLAIGGASASAPFLYAANIAQGRIDVFDGTFTNVTNTTFAGKFVDPMLPAGLAPFNVQTIGGFGGNIYVTYAPGGPPSNQSGATLGQGAVAIFKPDGAFVEQLITGGQLAAPWGVALAPASFGPFGGDLLVGNFAYGTVGGNLNPGGGEINAYNPVTGAFATTLDSNPLWEGLWDITFGNGGSGGNPNILYFTTGLNSEMDGLFAALAVVPEPSTLTLLGLGLLSVFGLRFRATRRLG
jgi:uncharacterized protein (TIGR03118 family)